MKKYTFAKLEIELTRKCNRQCAHCLRGQAQDKTISKKIIDKIFDDVGDCLAVYVCGGEAMMELDTLRYLVDKIARNWNTIQLEITTNGSILDESIVKALEQFCQMPPKKLDNNRKAQLTISKDEFHISGEWQKAWDFYKPLFDEANRRLGCSDDEKLILKTWSPVDKEETKKKKGKPVLLYAGNAIELAKGNNKYRIGKNLKVPSYNNHRLKIIDNIVYCTEMITVNGDVVVACEDDSYAAYDACAVGNILNEPLSDIIDRHQSQCLITCNESNFVNSAKQRQASKPGDISFVDDLSTQFLFEVITNIWNVREAVKIQYPMLPAQDIIIGLPFPRSDDEAVQYAKMICEHTPRKDRKQPDDDMMKQFLRAKGSMTTQKQEVCMLLMKALTYLRNTDCSALFCDALLKIRLGLLANQAKMYGMNIFGVNNEWVFPCGSNDIFTNKDTKDMRNEQ